MSSQTFHLRAEHDGLTLGAAVKRVVPERSWSQIRKLVEGRRTQVNGNLCLDAERKVKSGDVIKIFDQALAPPVRSDDVRLVYVDEHLIVVQKPAGVTTLRHREEADLPVRRRQLQPTLDELVGQGLAEHLGISVESNPGGKRDSRDLRRRQRKPKVDSRLSVRPVHRLDRDTSGLMVFARTPIAEQKLVHMFARHEVQRAYVAVVYGQVAAQTIESWLVRDRGDGLRGSAAVISAAGEEPSQAAAQRAITHVRPLEQLANYSVLECRLETGRTHQIRIHLSEIGHRLCGEKIYTHGVGQPPQAETSGAPRQALHAASLAFIHPVSGQALRFQMPLPLDLKSWLLRLPRSAPTS